MIKINLLGDGTVIDHSGKFILAGYAASVLGLLAIFLFMSNSVSGNVQDLIRESAVLQERLDKLQETTKEVRELEKKKKDLNDKLFTIATLKRNKIGPVRILDDLNKAIPEKSWLTEAREQGGLLKLLGYALDNQTVGTFMQDLEASDYFGTVDLVQTKQVDKKGVTVAEFTIKAPVSYAGKAKQKSKS